MKYFIAVGSTILAIVYLMKFFFVRCMKCFASLPVIKEKTKSKKYPDLRDLYMEAIDGIKGPEIWKDGFRFGAKEVVELLATKIEKNQIQIIERELKLS